MRVLALETWFLADTCMHTHMHACVGVGDMVSGEVVVVVAAAASGRRKLPQWRRWLRGGRGGGGDEEKRTG